MTEKAPEFRVEIIIDDNPPLDEREQTMKRILNLVDWGDYTQAQALVDESGVKYSEAAKRFS